MGDPFSLWFSQRGPGPVILAGFIYRGWETYLCPFNVFVVHFTQETPHFVSLPQYCFAMHCSPLSRTLWQALTLNFLVSKCDGACFLLNGLLVISWSYRQLPLYLNRSLCFCVPVTCPPPLFPHHQNGGFGCPLISLISIPACRHLPPRAPEPHPPELLGLRLLLPLHRHVS